MDAPPPIQQRPPRELRETLSAVLLRAVLRFGLRPRLAPTVSWARQRAWLNLGARLRCLPRGVRVEAANVAGVAGEWLHPAHPPLRAGAVLHVHGGAFCVGSPATHRALAARLAHASGLPVLVPDYPLAPEHPDPAAFAALHHVDAALAAHGPVLLSGDSAGATLALRLAIARRDAGKAPHAALLLISPWTDLDPEALAKVPGEALLSKPWLRAALAAFEASGTPRFAPLRADLHGLPPTLVQWGSDEGFAPGAAALLERLLAAGVEARGEVTLGRWHAFPLHAGLLPSADAAITRMARFALEHLDLAARRQGRPRPTRTTVVVLGAGMSGLCMGARLKRAGLGDFVILEQSEGLGGTWWDNRYPGAQVDVPAPVYAFSFAPNREARQRFADAAEIQAYQQRFAENEGLLAHLRLRTRVREALWDEARGEWTIHTADAEVLHARFFVCSTGPLSQPRWPDLPGLDDFRGLRLHSARWDAEAALDGRRIGVIGTGSSAVQIIPKLAARAAHLSVFQRTPNWVLPRQERRYGALDRFLSRVPGATALVRYGWAGFLEWTRRGFDEGTLARRIMLGLARWHFQRQLPDPALRAALAPPYPLGCKRIIYANDYYPTFALPHVDLVTAAIERVQADGVVTANGRHHRLDVLVCATGFDTVNLLASLRIEGRSGRTLAEAWKDGPEAYRGTTVAGFPNLFLLLGPNTATGHTSTLFYIEAAAAHALAAMRRVLDGGHRAIEVRAEAMLAHNLALQARLAGSVWAQCRSWYRLENGRVAAIFPGFTPEYVRGTRRPHWPDYRID